MTSGLFQDLLAHVTDVVCGKEELLKSGVEHFENAWRGEKETQEKRFRQHYNK